MIKVDLVTGFLGSGKTTFIREYAKYLNSTNQHIGIIENDFGAINVDMLSLYDLQSDMCEIEQIVGANVESDWKRRFKAKLISMAMRGFQRVIVEPSGIYDVDLFFDMLYDDPLCNWYEAGSVIALVDASISKKVLSKEENYYLCNQCARAGSIIISKSQDKEKALAAIDVINSSFNTFDCNREISEYISKNFTEITPEEFEEIANTPYVRTDHKKLWFDKNDIYSSEFIFDIKLNKGELENAIHSIFNDENCGRVMRVKGFSRTKEGIWLEYNATRTESYIRQASAGQEVMVIIGEAINKVAIEEIVKAG